MLAALPRILFARPHGRGRVRDAIATIVVATVVVGGASLITGTGSTPPVSPSGTDVWVDGSVGNDSTCVRSNQSFPCRTWSRAYTISQTGDDIAVNGGSYGATFLTGTKSVTFTVDTGETATITGELTLQSLQNATIVGPVNITSNPSSSVPLRVEQCSENLTLRNISGGYFDIGHSSHSISMYGGTWGNYTARTFSSDSVISGADGYPDGNTPWPGCGDGFVRDILIDGVTFEYVQYNVNGDFGGGHPDCLETSGSIRNLIVRNSTFRYCGNTFLGFYTDWGDNFGMVFENNVMYQTTDHTFYSIQIGTKPGYECDVVFRNNTVIPLSPNAAGAYAPPLINCSTEGAPSSRTLVYGNIFEKGPTGCSGIWSYNVYEQGGSCGTNNTTGATAFVNRAGFDFHLAAGSNALGAGNPSLFPSTDFEGDARTTPPDAGYDERT